MTQITELQERLEKARAERAAREAERREAEEIAELESELAKEAMLAKLDDELAKAKSQHGSNRVRAVVSDDPAVGFLIVKAPALPTYRKYVDKGSTSSADIEDLVRPCRVYPDQAEFDRVLSVQPGLLLELGNAVCELAGVRVGAAAKK